jgi:hypothetical protein
MSRRTLAGLRDRIRRHRLERAQRAHMVRMNGVRAPWIPGSEHTHLLQRRGF